MPILGAEQSLFPDNLLDDFVEQPSERAWWVLHSKPRQEKAIARELLRDAVPFYLPLVAKNRLVRGHKVQSYIPLFSGYVFLFGSEAQRVLGLKTNRVSGVLQVQDGQRMCADLRQVRRLIETGAPLTVEARLTPGRQVRIRRGAFAGLEGTVLVRRRKTRLVVAVDFLKQGISVEIDDFLLEPID